MNLLFNLSGQTQHKVVLQMAFTSSHTRTRTRRSTIPLHLAPPLLPPSLPPPPPLLLAQAEKKHHNPRGVPLEKSLEGILKDTIVEKKEEEEEKKDHQARPCQRRTPEVFTAEWVLAQS